MLFPLTDNSILVLLLDLLRDTDFVYIFLLTFYMFWVGLEKKRWSESG